MFFVSLLAVSRVEYLLAFVCEHNEVLQARLKLKKINHICIEDLVKLPKPVYGNIRNTNKVVSNEFRQSFENIMRSNLKFLFGSYKMAQIVKVIACDISYIIKPI